MQSITIEQIETLVSAYTRQLDSAVTLSGFVVAPGIQSPGCWFQCSGKSTPEINVSPVSIASPIAYNIGSTSKTFTASMLAQYPSSKPYDWGTIGDYLTQGELPKAIKGIPLLDLARYSSGFMDDNTIPQWLKFNGTTDLQLMQTVDDLYEALNDPDNNVFPLPQYRPPGKYWTYSNLAFGLLGLCLVGVKGKGGGHGNGSRIIELWNAALLKFLKEQNGLSMPSTMPYQCVPAKQREQMNCVNGSTSIDGTLTSLTPTSIPYIGGGGITSTLADMSQWLLFNMGYMLEFGSQIPYLTQTAYFQGIDPGNGMDAPQHYNGLGWMLSPPGSGVAQVFKDGGVLGYSSFMAFTAPFQKMAENPFAPPPEFVPPSRTGLVVLANYRNPGVSSLPNDVTVYGRWLMAQLLKATGQDTTAVGSTRS